ncbi:DNA gyrase subunit A [Mycoplasmopsis edwardii]|uniref:DNA gyrase subunit A n=1 Tax=Mycoplasmopsis edwardii TaxID=53558 RepID=A0ACD4PI43_9BACT|nr:DNA gyrase subunit A [Mycoplasmopsis edwardii]WBP84298.1 DNA gyrase subunit A [Mycoplasmopsis edwardii]
MSKDLNKDDDKKLLDDEVKVELETKTEYDYEEDNRMIFRKNVKVKEEIEEEEDAPQNSDEYEVSSQLISEPIDGLNPVVLDSEMKTSFLEYAMSVIVSRALPDARDGLKPVHRRILYDMFELGITSGSQHRKSARIVGDVLGKYHPHGDSSVYDAMVRMAQDFSMRYPLVDGHGNFGSIDGDQAAAMRYTEARMTKLSGELLESIRKDTVDFVDNYDATEKEPVVLPSRFPNLFVTGASGIAVGMATEIPPHNLGEIIDATVALAKNPEITTQELMKHVKGPDFPTGGIILGTKGILDTYETGRGSIIVRSKTEIIENANGKSRIIVTEIPYAVKTSTIVQKIVDLVKEKVIEGIADIRDETNLNGIRIVLDIKKGFNPHIILNQLFQKSYLQVSYSSNIVALVNGEPKLLNLKQGLEVYIDHQKEVVTRRLNYDLAKAEEKVHILEGLKIAVQNIDEVVRIIKTSKTDQIAQERLAERFDLSERQTKAILDMNLRRLTGLNYEKMVDEINALYIEIKGYKEILASEEKLINLIVEELTTIKEKYSDERRTHIDYFGVGKINDEDLIPQSDIVITTSVNGYVKRINLDEYNTQNRGGVGSISMKTYGDDDISMIIKASTHTDLLLFSNFGKAYALRGYQIPEGSKQSKGVPFINIIDTLNVNEGEKIISIIDAGSFEDNLFLATITKKGIFKKTPLSLFSNVRRNGLLAFKLQEGDQLVRAFIASEGDNIMVANNYKNIALFSIDDVRALGRTAMGVKAIKLTDDQYVINASSNKDGNLILSLGTKGFGKITDESEYRLAKRGAKGISGINPEKAGNLVFASYVKLSDELLVITSSGTTIRVRINQISETSRNTKGVKIINLKENDDIVAVEVIKTELNDEKSQENKQIDSQENHE